MGNLFGSCIPSEETNSPTQSCMRSNSQDKVHNNSPDEVQAELDNINTLQNIYADTLLSPLPSNSIISSLISTFINKYTVASFFIAIVTAIFIVYSILLRRHESTENNELFTLIKDDTTTENELSSRNESYSFQHYFSTYG